MRRTRRIKKDITEKDDSSNFLHLNTIDKIYYINLEKSSR